MRKKGAVGSGPQWSPLSESRKNKWNIARIPLAPLTLLDVAPK